MNFTINGQPKNVYHYNLPYRKKLAEYRKSLLPFHPFNHKLSSYSDFITLRENSAPKPPTSLALPAFGSSELYKKLVQGTFGNSENESEDASVSKPKDHGMANSVPTRSSSENVQVGLKSETQIHHKNKPDKLPHKGHTPNSKNLQKGNIQNPSSPMKTMPPAITTESVSTEKTNPDTDDATVSKIHSTETNIHDQGIPAPQNGATYKLVKGASIGRNKKEKSNPRKKQIVPKKLMLSRSGANVETTTKNTKSFVSAELGKQVQIHKLDIPIKLSEESNEAKNEKLHNMKRKKSGKTSSGEKAFMEKLSKRGQLLRPIKPRDLKTSWRI